MTRVFLCEVWDESKHYWKLEWVTDSKEAAERWRRDGNGRKYTDHICLNRRELEDSLSQDEP